MCLRCVRCCFPPRAVQHTNARKKVVTHCAIVFTLSSHLFGKGGGIFSANAAFAEHVLSPDYMTSLGGHLSDDVGPSTGYFSGMIPECAERGG